MSYPIGNVRKAERHVRQFKKAGVRTTDALLERAKTPRGRKALAAATGIEESLILQFANMADLMRLTGVSRQYAALLEAAGVDTVRDLRNRNPANLAKVISALNAREALVRLPPSEKVVTKWIAEAKTLPPMMTY